MGTIVITDSSSTVYSGLFSALPAEYEPHVTNGCAAEESGSCTAVLAHGVVSMRVLPMADMSAKITWVVARNLGHNRRALRTVSYSFGSNEDSGSGGFRVLPASRHSSGAFSNIPLYELYDNLQSLCSSDDYETNGCYDAEGIFLNAVDPLVQQKTWDAVSKAEDAYFEADIAYTVCVNNAEGDCSELKTTWEDADTAVSDAWIVVYDERFAAVEASRPVNEPDTVVTDDSNEIESDDSDEIESDDSGDSSDDSSDASGDVEADPVADAPSPSEDTAALDAGTIAGIAVGSLAGFGIIVALVIFCGKSVSGRGGRASRSGYAPISTDNLWDRNRFAPSGY